MDKTRQYSPTIDGIRPDHTARYRFASSLIPIGRHVLDMACGCGYGSWMLKQAGMIVTGVDIAQEAIDYAQKHYAGPSFICQKAEETKGTWGAIVSFETIEHLPDPCRAFEGVSAPLLIASVPNEEFYPFSKERFAGDKYPHLRHYTVAEFEALLEAMGYAVSDWYCQKDKRGEVIKGTDGMFLIAVARVI